MRALALRVNLAGEVGAAICVTEAGWRGWFLGKNSIWNSGNQESGQIPIRGTRSREEREEKPLLTRSREGTKPDPEGWISFVNFVASRAHSVSPFRLRGFA